MKDWKTSIVGVVMFVVGVAAFWLGKIDYLGAIAFITAGVGFWVAGDAKVKNG